VFGLSFSFSVESGSWTACRKGDDGSGFCEASAAPNEALVGVVASSVADFARDVCCRDSDAVVGRGVVGVAMSSTLTSGVGSGVFAGRKLVVMVDVVRERWG